MFEDATPKHSRRRRGRRVALMLFVVVSVLLLLPFLATLIYARIDPPLSALMVWRWSDGEAIDYRWSPLERISPYLTRAVVVSEDDLVCEHRGVNWEQMREVIAEAVEDGEASRGGSTIHMQIAKNLFLWPLNDYVRKALEIPLAYWMDIVWSKRRIIEIYLNIAEWAPGIYGAEAAARHHFRKSASALTPRDSVLLAVALPNPHIRNAGRPGPKTRRMALRLIRRLDRQGAKLDCLDL